MRLSVFVVTCGRPELVRACVDSVLVDLPQDGELVVVVNGSDRQTEAWLQNQTDGRLRWSVCVREPRALCRNRGFSGTGAEILLFLDDDVQVPPGFFAEVLRRFAVEGELSILGGPNRTPPGSPWLEQLFGAVMTSAFAAPLVYRRYAAGGVYRKASEHDLILCNLALRRAKIPAGLRFQQGLRSNEENLFLFHCRTLGLRIRASGCCFVFHRRRRDLTGFIRQIFSYGFGRAQQTVREPASAHWAFLVPAATLVVGPFWAAWHPEWLVLYGMLAGLGAVFSRETAALGLGGCVGVTLLTPVVHVCYGLGFWAGCGERIQAYFGGAAVAATAE